MHTNTVQRRRGDERGAAAVEFALVLPIFIGLVFAIINFGYLFAQSLALGNAARQTARYGVVENRTCAEVTTEAVNTVAPLVTLPSDSASVSIKRGVDRASAISVCSSPTSTEKPCERSAVRENIYVTLSYTADVLVPNITPGLTDTKGLTGTGVFRCEWS